MEQETPFKRLLRLIEQYYGGRTSGRFVDYREPHELQALLGLDDNGAAGDWEGLFHWVELYLAHAVKTGHPGYVNRMWADANLPSIIGEVVTAVTNTSACTYETAPVSTLMERYLIQTMLDLVGFGDGSGQMTTGSSNANMIAMMAARNTARPEVKAQGLFGRQELFAFVNAEAHYSMDRAANLLGIGVDHLVKVPVDDHGGMDPEALAESLRAVVVAGGRPFFVGATAGTTVRGGFDLLEPLLELRQQYAFWLHVDGAWGGAAVFSDRLRPAFLQGLEEADSFTLDFHKMLGTALMCNVLLFNNRPDILREVCSAGDESYIFRAGPGGEVRDLGSLSLQCGRRVDALKWFLDWKFFGKAGLGERVERYLALCAYAEERIRQMPELEMVVPRESFNVCFRCRPPEGVAAESFNRELRDRMHHRGDFLVGTGYVNGELCLRLLITNMQVDRPEIDAFLGTVVATGSELGAPRAKR